MKLEVEDDTIAWKERFKGYGRMARCGCSLVEHQSMALARYKVMSFKHKVVQLD